MFSFANITAAVISGAMLVPCLDATQGSIESVISSKQKEASAICFVKAAWLPVDQRKAEEAACSEREANAVEVRYQPVIDMVAAYRAGLL